MQLSSPNYVATYHPALLQLNLAMARLEKGSYDEIEALLDAARRVIEADGVLRQEELKFLDELSEELGRFRARA